MSADPNHRRSIGLASGDARATSPSKQNFGAETQGGREIFETQGQDKDWGHASGMTGTMARMSTMSVPCSTYRRATWRPSISSRCRICLDKTYPM